MRQFLLAFAAFGVGIGAALAGESLWYKEDGSTIPRIDASRLDDACRDTYSNNVEINALTIDFDKRTVIVTSGCYRDFPLPAWEGKIIRVDTGPRFVLK